MNMSINSITPNYNQNYQKSPSFKGFFIAPELKPKLAQILNNDAGKSAEIMDGIRYAIDKLGTIKDNKTPFVDVIMCISDDLKIGYYTKELITKLNDALDRLMDSLDTSNIIAKPLKDIVDEAIGRNSELEALKTQREAEIQTFTEMN